MIADSRAFHGAHAFVFTIMVAVCFAMSGAATSYGQLDTDVSDIWYRGYMLNKLAGEQEEAKEYLKALNSYNDALPLLRAVAEQFPNFHPEIVKERIRLIEESIKRVKGAMNKGSKPEKIPTAPTQGLLNPPSEVKPWQGNPTPNPPVQPVYPPTTVPVEPSFSQSGSLIETLLNQEREREARMKWQNQQITALTQQLQQREQDFKQVQVELNRALSAESQLKAQAASAASEAEWAQLFDEIAAELDTSNALNRRLLADLQASRQEVAVLKGEISQLRMTRDTTIEGGEIRGLMKQNEELRDQVEKIEKYAESIQELNREKNEEIAFLKQELTDVNKKWQSVKELNEQYQTRIEELRNKLMMFEKGLNSEEALLLADANPVVAAENDLLKGVVLKQIRRQAQRKMATDLLLAQLDKVGARTASIDAMLEDIATSSILTETEKSLFKGPAISDLIADAESRAQSYQPPAERKVKIVEGAGEVDVQTLEKELIQIQATARVNFIDGDFAKAEASWNEFLKFRPNNVPCLCNLALVKIKQKEYGEAEEILKKAINLKNDSGSAHYLLGRTYFVQGRNEDALASFETGLSYDPKNAKAHNSVGVIASQKGWIKRAETSFGEAVKINPKFGDAHFNLAVLFVTRDDANRAKAKEHYFKALNLGIPRDAAIENFLKDQNDAPPATAPEATRLYPKVELPTVGMVL